MIKTKKQLKREKRAEVQERISDRRRLKGMVEKLQLLENRLAELENK